MRLALVLLCAALLTPAAALADAAAAKEKATTVCAACHGADGNSTNPLWPRLAGQTARYLYLQLKDFKDGRRKDPLMSPMAANLSRQDMLDLADYFAAQKPAFDRYKIDEAKVVQGKQIAADALCPMCHLGEFSGQNEVPRVKGQHYEYIVKQLKDFRARNRTNDAGNMTAYTQGLTDEQIDALAQYITNLY
ncbi:MAG TPA: c-type cytochrome [Burkholderiales bacterium]|nr:c-type cytochrome [Burkholderiales bacterium]